QDKYVAEILRKFRLTEGKSASTPIDTEKPLLKDPESEDVDVHTYRSMIGSLMYLTSSRPNIMFAVCACAHFQVTPKASHLHAVKRIFRYLKGKLHLGLWYPKDSPFDLVAYSDSDYAGASLDRKSTTGGCQFLGCRLISWQCKKQTVVATSSTKAEYVAAASYCAQVYGFRINCWIMEHIEIRHHVIRDCNEKKLIQVVKIPTENNFADLLTKAFNVGRHKLLLFSLTNWCCSLSADNDITRLQALVDKKKVAVIELQSEKYYDWMIRKALIACPTKRFLQSWHSWSMSAKRTSWNEFNSAMASAVICLSTGKGFSRVETPLFEVMLVEQVIEEGGDEEEHNQPYHLPLHLLHHHNHLKIFHQHPRRVEHLEYDKVAQALEITKLKRRVKKLEKGNRGRKIDEIDKDDVVALMDDTEDDKKEEEAKEDEPAEVQEVVDVVTTAKLITEVVTAASETITAASTTISAAEPQVPATTITAAPSKDKGKRIMVEEPKPLKKKQHFEMDEEYARKLHAELNKDIDWDVAIEHVKQKAKEDPANVAGFRLDYFKGMSYDDIRPIFEAKFNSNIEFLLKTKEQMEEEESKALQKATPLARNVHVMDYEIIHLNNKHHYKIIRADGTHQLFVSFLTLLKNFDREDLESLWSLVKERFSKSKPNNFFDDFLLTTLGAMFERPDGQAQVWKNKRTVHGQAKVKSWKLLEMCGVHIITFTTTHLILLVERRHPLLRFTLDQMLNGLRVEEQSEISLELLSAVKQKLMLLDSAAEGRLMLLSQVKTEFTFKVIDTKGAENLAADHLSQLENPHQNAKKPLKFSRLATMDPHEVIMAQITQPIRCTPYKLVYEKSCHLPVKLEHKAYWALKHANFDLKTVGDHRKVQINELIELRDQAYENSLIYKEKTKRLHDLKIKNRVFNIDDRVLLFNSSLKIFSGKLKSRWSGPFTIS
nr:hypothetical protein [Tanacetum cinerariifolium]